MDSVGEGEGGIIWENGIEKKKKFGAVLQTLNSYENHNICKLLRNCSNSYGKH